jgi:hypothetical protein
MRVARHATRLQTVVNWESLIFGEIVVVFRDRDIGGMAINSVDGWNFWGEPGFIMRIDCRFFSPFYRFGGVRIAATWAIVDIEIVYRLFTE